MPSAPLPPNSQKWLYSTQMLQVWILNIMKPTKFRSTKKKFAHISPMEIFRSMVSPRHHSHAATLDGTADLTALTLAVWVLKTASQAAAIPMAPTSLKAISCAVKEASEKPRSSNRLFFGTKKKMVGWVFWTSFFWSCLTKTFGIVKHCQKTYFGGNLCGGDFMQVFEKIEWFDMDFQSDMDKGDHSSSPPQDWTELPCALQPQVTQWVH